MRRPTRKPSKLLRKLKNNSKSTKIRFFSRKRIKSLRSIREREKISPSKRELRSPPRSMSLDWQRWILDTSLFPDLRMRSSKMSKKPSAIKISIRLSWKIWSFSLWSSWWKRKLNLSAFQKMFLSSRVSRKSAKSHSKISWRPTILSQFQPPLLLISLTTLKMKTRKLSEESFSSASMERYNVSILLTQESKWYSKSTCQKSDPVCSRILSEFESI